MKKVYFIDTVHPFLEDALKAEHFDCVDASSWDYDSIVDALADAYGLVIRSRFPVDEKLLNKAGQLRFIARSGAGMENIDENFCSAKNIVLFNAPEGNRNAVAEHALGMLLALFNQLGKCDSEVRQGIWDREGNRGIELDGKTVGIIGFGNNGSAFAHKLSGFDVRILAYDKYKTGFGTERIEESSLNAIFDAADVLSFHVPQNEETLFMGNKRFFQQFKRPIYLINLSRGKIVKLSDLLDALNEKRILGACLDVLEIEKPSFEKMDSEKIPEELRLLFQRKNILFSPHVGGWTTESYYKLSSVLANKIIAWNKKNP